MAIDIIGFILETILKIDPYTIANYINVQDQLLYLVLIPHTILFLFLYSFINSILSPPTQAPAHRGLRLLLGIVAYIFIIWAGWYAILVPIFITWFKLLIIIGVIFYLGSKFIHPSRMREIFALSYGKGKNLAEAKVYAKKIERKIDEIDREINNLKKGGVQDPYTMYRIKQLKAQKEELKHQLKKV